MQLVSILELTARAGLDATSAAVVEVWRHLGRLPGQCRCGSAVGPGVDEIAVLGVFVEEGIDDRTVVRGGRALRPQIVHHMLDEACGQSMAPE
jgi:hypothetical protein